MRLERLIMLDTALEARSCQAETTVSMPSVSDGYTFLKLLLRHNKRASENTANVRIHQNICPFGGYTGLG